MKRVAALLLTASLTPGSPADARGAMLYAGGGWAAIDRGAVCEALARPMLAAPRGQPQAVAGFAFTPDHRRWGEFHARLSRVPRAGSSVLLTIGSTPFLLVAQGGWAWSRDPLQEQAIIAAARYGPVMRLVARDSGGRRFADSYALDGAATAIDSAAARCALRGAGKIG